MLLLGRSLGIGELLHLKEPPGGPGGPGGGPGGLSLGEGGLSAFFEIVFWLSLLEIATIMTTNDTNIITVAPMSPHFKYFLSLLSSSICMVLKI